MEKARIFVFLWILIGSRQCPPCDVLPWSCMSYPKHSMSTVVGLRRSRERGCSACAVHEEMAA